MPADLRDAVDTWTEKHETNPSGDSRGNATAHKESLTEIEWAKNLLIAGLDPWYSPSMTLNKKEIQLDQEDIDIIAEVANQRGEHWKEVLKRQLRLLCSDQNADPVRTAEAFRQRVKELSSHGPSLPDDFSRRDIYFE